MPAGAGWYLLGPVFALALVGAMCAALRPLWAADRDDNLVDGLAIFAEPEDYGLLSPAAVTRDRAVADEIRRLLRAAGIRATHAVRADDRVAVLVFAEEVEEARRLVGDTPAR